MLEERLREEQGELRRTQDLVNQRRANMKNLKIRAKNMYAVSNSSTHTHMSKRALFAPLLFPSLPPPPHLGMCSDHGPLF